MITIIDRVYSRPQARMHSIFICIGSFLINFKIQLHQTSLWFGLIVSQTIDMVESLYTERIAEQ